MDDVSGDQSFFMQVGVVNFHMEARCTDYGQGENAPHLYFLRVYMGSDENESLTSLTRYILRF